LLANSETGIAGRGLSSLPKEGERGLCAEASLASLRRRRRTLRRGFPSLLRKKRTLRRGFPSLLREKGDLSAQRLPSLPKENSVTSAQRPP